MLAAGAYSLLGIHPADVAALNAYWYRLAAAQDRLACSAHHHAFSEQVGRQLDLTGNNSRYDVAESDYSDLNDFHYNVSDHGKSRNNAVKRGDECYRSKLSYFDVRNAKAKNDVIHRDDGGCLRSVDTVGDGADIDDEHSPLDQLSLLTPTGVRSLSRTMSAVTAHKTPAVVADRDASRVADKPPRIKFSISRILSEDFGTGNSSKKSDTEGGTKNSAAWGSDTSRVCPDRSLSMYLATCPFVYRTTSSLRAVHAIQPPHYQLPIGDDALPGPYSVLSADTSPGNQKRKRSWSRAVFSQLQRKGLEKRFDVQKYVTKPDRRKLAAMLGLTDAQVKVWFQNRRMKWRHAEKCEESKDAVTVVKSSEKTGGITRDVLDTERSCGASDDSLMPLSNSDQSNTITLST